MSQVQAANDADNAEVLYAIDGHIATITLNRPERMNTISRDMLHQLTEHMLKRLAKNPYESICAEVNLTSPGASAGMLAGTGLGSGTCCGRKYVRVDSRSALVPTV